MRSKIIINSAFIFVVVLLINTSCKSPKKDEGSHAYTKQEIAEDAIKSWMLTSKEYPHYKPVVFGDLAPRYEKSNRTLLLTIQIAEEEILSQANGDKQKLDSLKNEIEKYKGDLLGYLIPHKFTEKNLAGETLTKELLFFLDTTLRIASVLSPESFDFIMDERVFFRLDSIQQEKPLE
jgi:hypothetical protein